MSLKDLFKGVKSQYLSSTSLNDLTGNLESVDYIKFYLENKKRFIPLVDYSEPKNFARFGSAEKYYYDSIRRTFQTYPYDGSKKEKILWELSSSHLDLYLFENGYPRTTGYVTFTSESLTATATSTNKDYWGSYGAAGTASYEYIFVNGGPHEGSGKRVYLDPDTGEAKYRKNANIWDTSKNRECNLKIGGTDGNTVEFWLKKAAFDTDATEKEVIFDIHTTSSISSSADYGRLRVEMTGSKGSGGTGGAPFLITYMSGTAGFANQAIGSSITSASIADDSWHHYTFRFKNTGSNVVADLFIDGAHNHRVTAGTTVDYVSGTIVGTLAALATYPSGTEAGAPQAYKGWGKLSGSLDEFRYWKTWRSSEQIQTRWFDQVGGGTNTDEANTHLGVYYKFNEGIALASSIDSTVLDYSGRVSNGTWTGYNSNYSRNTGSAIDDANATMTNFTGSEFRDPILYATQPDVASFLTNQRNKGKLYDYTNPSNLYYSIPTWILEEHDANNPNDEGLIGNSLWNLIQILSSYFDDVAAQIKSIPSITQPDYRSVVSGTIAAKPIPFMDRALEGKGFVSPEIFSGLDALEALENRDNNSLYTQKMYDVKNTIYQNIYNNLQYIYKSKGTEKSFRNLVRCFGIDDEIYKFNVYSNNVEYIFRNNYRSVAEKHKLINFNTIANSDGTIYQYSSSLNPNSTKTYIAASENYDSFTSPEASLPFSVEANVIFPFRGQSYGDASLLLPNATKRENNYPIMQTASLFGLHTAIDTDPGETTWADNDYANFVVKAIKPELYTNKAYFALTGTAGGFIHPELISSEYNDVYNDTNWSFGVSLYPQKYLNANQIPGTSGSAHGTYVVEFSGIQSILDVTINEFTVSGTMDGDQAIKFMASPKRLFAGAHRTNFTGSLLNSSEVKFNNLKVWQNKLSISDLKVHSADPNNYGLADPAQNAYLFNSSINKVYVPNKETLLLYWNFDNVTGSDASGEFIVEDLTSGSITQTPRYGWLSEINKQQYLGKAYEFEASSTEVSVLDEIITARPNLPEVIGSGDMITVMQNDDIYFTRDKRPTFFDLYVEKSLYQNVSQEMLKFMAGVVDFNNLIGHPVDIYRHEYKSLGILRESFFQRLKSAPDVDKYIEYFKWFDIAIASMIQKIAPMSSGLDERPLRTIIESHILERSKYQNKFPTYEFKQSDPEGSLLGVNELLYDWEFGKASLYNDDRILSAPGPYSLLFNGVNSEVQITDSDLDYTPDDDDRSWSIWFKGGGNALNHLFVHGETVASVAIYVTSAGVLYFNDLDGSYVSSGATLDLDQWNNVTVTIDKSGGVGDGVQKVYVNGVLVVTDAFVTTGAATGQLTIGATAFSGHKLKGNADWFTYWTKLLSGDEVEELYNNGKLFNLEDFSAYSDIKLWWKLGDGPGGLADDFSGNDYNGTLFGVTLRSTIVPDYEGSSARKNNCLWLDERASRTGQLITSGDAAVDADRDTILTVLNNQNNATAPNLSGSDGAYEGSTFAIRRFARPYKLSAAAQKEIHGGSNTYENKKIGFWDAIRQRPTPDGASEGAIIAIEPTDSSLESFKSCDDDSALRLGKRKYSFSAQTSIDGNSFTINDKYKGDLILPFSLYSSSINNDGSRRGGEEWKLSDFQANLDITNLHSDAYGPFNDVPMQGPFTEKYVGGRPYRHVFSTFTRRWPTDAPQGERLEGWMLNASSGKLVLVNPDTPSSPYFRNEIAKRPVNIANIQQTTGAVTADYINPLSATIIGNYSKGYEIVMTNGRSINNRYMAEADGIVTGTVTYSPIVSGSVEFPLPRRDLTGSNSFVIVNRFSSPGDPATMGEGMLDLAAAEYSVYNALPWRNLSVREPLDELYSDHCKQFGYFSDAFNSSSWAQAIRSGLKAVDSYPGTSGSVNENYYYKAGTYADATASFHKINRNGRLQPYLSEYSTFEYTNTHVLSLDGEDNYANIGSPETWDAIIGNDTAGGSNETYTLSAWIWATSLGHSGGGSYPTVFDFGTQDIYFLIAATGRLYFGQKFTGATGIWKTDEDTIETETWYHIAVTYDATDPDNDPKIYVNGVSATAAVHGSRATGDNFGIAATDCFIGQRADGSFNFSGYIDEPSIWNGVLTDLEILEIYNGYYPPDFITRRGVGNLSNHSAVSKLVSWWRVDTSPGTTELTDDHGSNDGTLEDSAMRVSATGDAELQPVKTYVPLIHKRYDNWFVQHQIPQTDLQYAWITASVINGYTGPAAYGFEKPDFSNASLASTDLTFVSASSIKSFVVPGLYPPGEGRFFASSEPVPALYQYRIPVDFVGLNTLVYEPITSSTNVLGYPSLEVPAISTAFYSYRGGLVNYLSYNGSINIPQKSTYILNGLLLHRQGPYGWPSWKQVRGEQHPIVRAHRQENRLSYLDRKVVYFDDGTSIINTRQIASAIEPPITSKFKPLRHNLKVKLNVSPAPGTPEAIEAAIAEAQGIFAPSQDVSIDHTYLNNLAYFTDHASDGVNLDQKILSNRNKPITQQTLDAINYYLLSGKVPKRFNPIAGFRSLQIKETIYPKGQYTYLSGTRARLLYQNNYWRDTRENRKLDRGSLVNDLNNLQPFLPSPLDATLLEAGMGISASIWPLDARYNFSTASPGRIKSGTLEGQADIGDLADSLPIVSGTSDIAGILQNASIPYSCDVFVKPALLPGFSLGGTLLPQYNRRIAGVIPQDTTHEYKFGDTKWEAADQSGIKPFYDTYADYVDDIKRVGKDHGILPEFRISEHMDFYLNQKGGNFLAKNTASFTITGSVVSSSAQGSTFYKRYSHTDFLKTFRIVNGDYQHIGRSNKITLSVDALIKFLPYDGFYPADRTVQLAKLFWESYTGSIAVTGTLYPLNCELPCPTTKQHKIGDGVPPESANWINPVWKSLFAPGILYNSIKSGLAVDYPVHTSNNDGLPIQISGSPNQRNGYGFLEDIPRIATYFDYRVPFEALANPEGYIGGVSIINNEPHPSASFDLTASLATSGKNNYKLAMNNFLASTIQFFKTNGKMTTLISRPLEQAFDTDKEYVMRIVCHAHGPYTRFADLANYFTADGLTERWCSASYIFNPPSLVMYAQTGTLTGDLYSVPPSQADYYGSAFGPPIQDESMAIKFPEGLGNRGALFGSASYGAFTPPYYDGYSHIELTYKPTFAEQSLEEIMTELRATATYFRFPQTMDYLPDEPGSVIKSLMNITASINWDTVIKQKEVTFDATGNPVFVGGDSAGDTHVWVIQPKWETPVLNFKDVEVTLPLTGSGSVARGMWHQYGSIPKSSDEGIFLQIQDLDPTEYGANNPHLTASLADILGFKKEPVAIGKIAETKTISEAIVAIPFYKRQGKQIFFTIPSQTIELAEAVINKTSDSALYKNIIANHPDLKPDLAVIEMVKKMKKFVIPPRYDFISNKPAPTNSNKPFAMFIFDFNVDLDQQDLANIWQNLSPDIATTAQIRNASLPASIFAASDEKGTGMMESDLFQLGADNVQWLVFKAKQRAAYNYFAMTADSAHDTNFTFGFDIGDPVGEKNFTPNYSYNWPYDFFSLVELAKIDAEVNIAPPEPPPGPGGGDLGAVGSRQAGRRPVPESVYIPTEPFPDLELETEPPFGPPEPGGI